MIIIGNKRKEVVFQEPINNKFYCKSIRERQHDAWTVNNCECSTSSTKIIITESDLRILHGDYSFELETVFFIRNLWI